jgi:diguanylate cyclase (GGDEF)-like protein
MDLAGTPPTPPERPGIRRMLSLVSSGYEGSDPVNASRVVGIICSLSALLALVFLPLDPPTEPLGNAGWAVAVAVIVAGLVAGRVLRGRIPPVSFPGLLAVSYAGLFAVAILQWLGGGFDATYRNLTILWIGAALGIHPPRRGLLFLAVATVVTAAPLVYGDPTAGDIKELVATYLFWVMLGLGVLGLMSYIRAQRVLLRDREQEAQQLARADELTGLANRRGFDEALEAELARSRRAKSTTSVGMLDIDSFKMVNDRHGHLDGDRCLRDVATAIGRALRAGDRAFRWGGDEFVLLFPDTGFEGAEQAMARIAAEVLNTCAAADGTPISVSWGTAETEPGMEPRELLGQADLGLMTLKREKQQA